MNEEEYGNFSLYFCEEQKLEQDKAKERLELGKFKYKDRLKDSKKSTDEIVSYIKHKFNVVEVKDTEKILKNVLKDI